MEYPVLTGLYQYVSMALAKTYTTMTKLVSMPIVAEVVMFFNIAAFGLRWRGWRRCGRRRDCRPAIWDAAVVAGSPLLIFQVFTKLRRVGDCGRDRRAAGLVAAKTGACRGADRRRCCAQALPVAAVWCRWRSSRRAPAGCARWARRRWLRWVTWLVVNLPVMVLFPAGWSEFFRLNTRRGDDMDSLYNVIKSFTGWRGFDQDLVSGSRPSILNSVTAVLFVLCCAGIAYIALTAQRRPRLAQLAFLVVAAFC